MKITKRQLQRIIREERARLAEYGDFNRDALQGRFPRERAPGGNKMVDHTIFKSRAIYDLIESEIEDYLTAAGADGLAKDEATRMELALTDAMKALIGDYVL
jgi:hypothetical protein